MADTTEQHLRALLRAAPPRTHQPRVDIAWGASQQTSDPAAMR